MQARGGVGYRKLGEISEVTWDFCFFVQDVALTGRRFCLKAKTTRVHSLRLRH